MKRNACPPAAAPGILALIMLCLAMPSVLQAQYYDERDYRPSELRYFYGGVMQRDFAPRPSNGGADSLLVRFNKLMPFIGFRQGPVDITFGYTQFSQQGATRSAIFLGTVISNEFPLAGRRAGALVLPLMLAADYTKAESGGPERESFNIASVGIGVGLKYRQTSSDVDFSLSAGELFQYAIEGLSTGSGFSPATVAEASLVLRDFLVFDGIAVGYRFRLQTWSMLDSQFNYRVISHGPYLGVLF